MLFPIVIVYQITPYDISMISHTQWSRHSNERKMRWTDIKRVGNLYSTANPCSQQSIRESITITEWSDNKIKVKLGKWKVITLGNSWHMLFSISHHDAYRCAMGQRVSATTMIPVVTHTMMTSSNGNIFRVTDPLWRKSTCHKGQWRRALMFLWSAPEQTVE